MKLVLSFLAGGVATFCFLWYLGLRDEERLLPEAYYK